MPYKAGIFSGEDKYKVLGGLNRNVTIAEYDNAEPAVLHAVILNLTIKDNPDDEQRHEWEAKLKALDMALNDREFVATFGEQVDKVIDRLHKTPKDKLNKDINELGDVADSFIQGSNPGHLLNGLAKYIGRMGMVYKSPEEPTMKDFIAEAKKETPAGILGELKAGEKLWTKFYKDAGFDPREILKTQKELQEPAKKAVGEYAERNDLFRAGDIKTIRVFIINEKMMTVMGRLVAEDIAERAFAKAYAGQGLAIVETKDGLEYSFVFDPKDFRIISHSNTTNPLVLHDKVLREVNTLLLDAEWNRALLKKMKDAPSLEMEYRKQFDTAIPKLADMPGLVDKPSEVARKAVERFAKWGKPKANELIAEEEARKKEREKVAEEMEKGYEKEMEKIKREREESEKHLKEILGEEPMAVQTARQIAETRRIMGTPVTLTPKQKKAIDFWRGWYEEAGYPRPVAIRLAYKEVLKGKRMASPLARKDTIVFLGAMFLLGALAIQALDKDSCLHHLVRGEMPEALR